MGTLVPYGITQYYLPPGKGDIPAFTPGRLQLLSARPAVTPAALGGLLPILLLGEQRHNECEQFAEDCYPTASRLRFEPGPFCD